MAKTDLGGKYADRELLLLEKRLTKVYSEAQRDVQSNLDVFFAKYSKENDIWQKKIKSAKSKEELAQVQKEYREWMKRKVFRGKQWQAKRDSIANTLTHSNEVAFNMINEAIPKVFIINGNYAAYAMEQGKGIDFGFELYDTASINALLKDDANILPFKKLNKAVDKRWNFQNIRNEVAKGIIKGDSINKIAKSLSKEMSNRNMSMVKTHARTMVNSAQNRGRLTRFEEAQKKGIEMQKEWFCTLDGRTRDTHRLLDRQRKPLDEPFEVDGFEIMYPCDPHAHPSMVYNCRCTMNSYMKKYPPQYTTRSARDENGDSVLIKDMSYEEWLRWKEGK